jgi:hypothetical protein
VNTRAPCPAASCAPAATARTNRSTHVACARDADSAAELRLRAAQLPRHQLEGAHQGFPPRFSSILATGPSRINGVRQVAVTFPAVRKALRLRRWAASHLIERPKRIGAAEPRQREGHEAPTIARTTFPTYCFPAHAAFPNWSEGRHPHCHFRGPRHHAGNPGIGTPDVCRIRITLSSNTAAVATIAAILVSRPLAN